VKRVAVFFYGLFMDRALLRAKGIQPARMQRASVKGFRLQIGRRATLVPASRATVHGMLAFLSHAEIEALYSEPTLSDYRPEAVEAILQSGGRRAALCFNLPAAPSARERNEAYAAQLRALAHRLKLPARYVASIK
jgi:hypothetical protein